jgi:hypothetical protein
MIDKYESSRTSLTEIKERFHNEEVGKINEDTTRFRYIDNLLTDPSGATPFSAFECY